MTTKAWCCVGVLALVLLMPATASACGWVLWKEWGGGLVRQPDWGLYNPYRFQPVAAYDTRADCDQARRSTAVPAGYVSTVCLPDTVDPLGGRSR